MDAWADEVIDITRRELFRRGLHSSAASASLFGFRGKLYEALDWPALQAGSERDCGTDGRTLVAFSAHRGPTWTFGCSLWVFEIFGT